MKAVDQIGQTLPRLRRALRLSLVVRLGVVTLALWAFVIEPRRLMVHSATLTLPGWPSALVGLRVVAISDLHVGGPHMSLARLARVVARANELEPDVIVLLGDFVSTARVGGSPDVAAIGTTLGQLRARLGVYAVLGNHDWWHGGPEVRRALSANGIAVIDDEAVPIVREGARAWLVGIADFTTQHPHPARMLEEKQLPVEEPIICITHDPDVFPRVPARVALTLAGHTHGGQVRVPFFGAPVVPSVYRQRYVAGLVHEAGHQLFVTTGVGTSILPVRFGVVPELAVLTIR